MKLYFVRHGESVANILQVISNRDLLHGLTEKGRQQAEILASTLTTVPVHKIYCSSLLRAKETAEIVGKVIGLVPEITDALREYDCGNLEGTSGEQTWLAYQEICDQWLKGNYAACSDQGESMLDMQARFMPFINSLIEQYQALDSGIVLISHGGLYRQMLPLIVKNVDMQFSYAHVLLNTQIIVAELQNGELICTSWAGLPMATV